MASNSAAAFVISSSLPSTQATYYDRKMPSGRVNF